jgi:hypothetical protein
VEPTTGIEPVDLFLTKEALYRLSYVGSSNRNGQPIPGTPDHFKTVERATRFELATSSLEGWSSTS